MAATWNRPSRRCTKAMVLPSGDSAGETLYPPSKAVPRRRGDEPRDNPPRPGYRAVEGRSLYAPADPLASLAEADKVSLLHRLETYARQHDPRVTQVVASLAGEYEVVFVTRLDGRSAADVRPLARVSLQVIVEENGKREQGSAGGGGRFDYAYFTDDRLKDYARLAVEQALTNLDAARP
ncbi:MAG: hypothetical protein HC834_05475, partial [Rhodospirillales bacterium]|nr:hypothetical protein [Rhodospirillales bacterium]